MLLSNAPYLNPDIAPMTSWYEGVGSTIKVVIVLAIVLMVIVYKLSR